MMRACFVAMLVLLHATPVTRALAQDAPSAPVLAAIDRARTMLDNGQGVAARNLLDSLVDALPNTSTDLAEVLHWRAVMAESIGAAEHDWKRLLVEAPLSDRAAQALVRLAELEALRGNGELSRQLADRLLRDHPRSPHRGKGLLLVARGWIAANNLPNACRAVGELRALSPTGELALQSTELMTRCANVDATPSSAAMSGAAIATPPVTSTSANTSAAQTSGDATTGKYAVQLAAYQRRADADAMVKQLAGMGIEARVVGTRAPFRVRTGRFATRAAATEALAQFTKRGMKGFVAEIIP